MQSQTGQRFTLQQVNKNFSEIIYLVLVPSEIGLQVSLLLDHVQSVSIFGLLFDFVFPLV